MLNKLSTTITTAALVAFVSTASAARPAQLTLKSDETLKGTVQAISKDTVTFSAAYLKKPIVFSQKQLDELTFLDKPAHKQADQPKTLAAITLKKRQAHIKNKSFPLEKVQGTLIDITNEHVNLQTSYSGLMKVSRSKVEDINIKDAGAVIFDGPLKLAEWDQSPINSWSEIEGGLKTSNRNGAVMREFNFAERNYMTFTHKSSQRIYNCRFYISLMCNKTMRGGEYYSIQNYGSSIYVRKYSKLNFKLLSHERIPAAIYNATGDVKVEIYFAPKTGEIGVFFNGEKVVKFVDPDPIDIKNCGKFLNIQSGSSYGLSLHNFRLERWIGKLPEKNIETRLAKLNPDGERIDLQNGDILFGKITKLEESKVTVKTKYSDFILPVAVIKRFNLKLDKDDQIRLEKNDIRARFADGSSFIFQLKSANTETLEGYSQAFGDQKFDFSQLININFNIYDN